MAFGKLLFIFRNVAHKKNDDQDNTTKKTKKTKNKALSQDDLIDMLDRNILNITKSALSKYERDILKNQRGLWGNSKEDTAISSALKSLFLEVFSSEYLNNKSAFVMALNNAVNIGANTRAQGDKMIFSETTKNFLLQIINQNDVNEVIDLLIYHAKKKDFSSFETDEEYIASLNCQIAKSQTKKTELLPGNTYTLPTFTNLAFIGRDKEIADLNVMLDSIPDQTRPKAPIIIYGEEGIGKTALAIHFARQYTDRKNSKAYYLSFERSMYETIVGTFAPLLSSTREDYFHWSANKPADRKLFSDVIDVLSSTTHAYDIIIIDNIDCNPKQRNTLSLGNSDDTALKNFWELCRSFPKGESGDTQLLSDFDLFKELSGIPAQLILITSSTPQKGNEHYIHLEAMPSPDIETIATSIWNKFKDGRNNLTKQQLISAINKFSLLVNNNTLDVTLFAHTACYYPGCPNLNNWLNSIYTFYKNRYCIYKFLFEHSALNTSAKQFLYIASRSFRVSLTAVGNASKGYIGDSNKYLKHLVSSGFMYFDYPQKVIYFHSYVQYFLDHYASEVNEVPSSDNQVSWGDASEDRDSFLFAANGININAPVPIPSQKFNSPIQIIDDDEIENLADDLKKIISTILDD